MSFASRTSRSTTTASTQSLSSSSSFMATASATSAASLLTSSASLAEEVETTSSEADGKSAAELAALTRHLEKDIKTQIQIKKFKRAFRGQFIEMCIYAAFLTVFSLAILNSRDPLYSFQLNNYMKDLMLLQEFPPELTRIYKSFFDVATWDEFNQYMSTVFLDSLFVPTEPGLGAGYVYGLNAIVGSVRLRQVRVGAGHCAVESQFKSVVPACYARYARATVDKAPFTARARRYYSASELKTGETIALLQWYEGGGFIEDFSPADNITVHRAHMAQLFDEQWVDLGTRVIFADFSVYNANLNLLQVSQMAFEFMPSGGVTPSYVFRVIRLYKYADTALGRAQLVGELIIVCFVAFYLLQEMYELWDLGCLAYWQSTWNIIDLVNVLLFISVFAVRGAFVAKVTELNVDPSNQRTFYNMQPLSLLNSTEQNVLACNAFVLWFKIFKYTKFLPGMDVISETVARSIQNTVSFVAMMTFVLFGFAQAGVLAFGTDVPGFHTFIDTFFTLLRSLLGDFDFVAMQRSNRVFGPLYFLTFVVLVLFILLSMFMAILNDAYSAVQDELRTKQQGKVNLLHVFGDWMKDKAQSLDQIELGAENLESAVLGGDFVDDDMLDRDEIEAIFQKYKREAKQLLGVNSADELLREFDADGDNLLSIDEQRALLHNLQERKLQAQVAKHQLSLSNKDSAPLAVLDGTEHESEFNAYLTSVRRDLLMFHDRMSKLDAMLQLVVERQDSSHSNSSS